jgi:hypothetical protein
MASMIANSFSRRRHTCKVQKRQSHGNSTVYAVQSNLCAAADERERVVLARYTDRRQ